MRGRPGLPEDKVRAGMLTLPAKCAEPGGTGAAGGRGCADRGRQEASLGPGRLPLPAGCLEGAGGFHGRCDQPVVPDDPGVTR